MNAPEWAALVAAASAGVSVGAFLRARHLVNVVVREARDGRDRARRVAVTLEQELAEVTAWVRLLRDRADSASRNRTLNSGDRNFALGKVAACESLLDLIDRPEREVAP